MFLLTNFLQSIYALLNHFLDFLLLSCFCWLFVAVPCCKSKVITTTPATVLSCQLPFPAEGSKNPFLGNSILFRRATYANFNDVFVKNPLVCIDPKIGRWARTPLGPLISLTCCCATTILMVFDPFIHFWNRITGLVSC